MGRSSTTSDSRADEAAETARKPKARKVHIVMVVAAVLAAAVLFVTYGTVLPSAPFVPIQLDRPTSVDSNGEFTVVADTESRRALIINEKGNLTGVMSCLTIDSPFEAITDVCVSNGSIYVSGVRYVPDSDVIKEERVAQYDKGGNFKGIVYSVEGSDSELPSIKSLNNTEGGVAIIYEIDNANNAKNAQNASGKSDSASDASSGSASGASSDSSSNSTNSASSDSSSGASDDSNSTDNPEMPNFSIVCLVATNDGIEEVQRADAGIFRTHDAAFSKDDKSWFSYLSIRGMLNDSMSGYANDVYSGHVYTSIDIDDKGTLYATDDTTGSLCTISAGSTEAKEILKGSGYDQVHLNKGVVSLCDSETNSVVLCDASGSIIKEFTEVTPSIGFSARMVLVWASGLYLLVLVFVLGGLKMYRQIKENRAEGLGPLLLSLAVVSAVAVAIGNLSFVSYQSSLDTRAHEINMCADYLADSSSGLSEPMEKIGNRDALQGSDDELTEAFTNLIEAANPAMMLVNSANENNIGMYCTLYGKDDKGIFYLFGSSSEFVMGSTARIANNKDLEAAFQSGYQPSKELIKGRTLRDATQYRLVPIPTTDGKGVAGVIEIGNKTRSFEAALTGHQAQRVLALLVLVFVVYLAYSELRSCGRCLFRYRQRQQEDPDNSIATLTRPFTLAITMLTSIDSVMTVLIARDLLTKAGMGDNGPLLALPAAMLGIGLICGQGLFGLLGDKVGLRRLVASGAFAMLLCTIFTGTAVASGNFWLYCAAKLTMSIPFGMLYALGYSLPRLAKSDDVRAVSAGGVKRTDTSAAALGTVLGGYAAQVLGNVWVYVLVGIACLPVIILALSLLPRGLEPLEVLARRNQKPTQSTAADASKQSSRAPAKSNGKKARLFDFLKTPNAIGLALLVVLPATVAAGYASFLFPLFSVDLGLSKSDINNICVLGQLVVYLCITQIDRMEARYGKWKVTSVAIAFLGVVFLLFSVNTTLVWSIAVVAFVGVLCKSSDGWKAMWLKSAEETGITASSATGAMFATRSLALIVQPSILGALVGSTDSEAVIVIGLICVVCAIAFFFLTRRTSLAEPPEPQQEPGDATSEGRQFADVGQPT